MECRSVDDEAACAPGVQRLAVPHVRAAQTHSAGQALQRRRCVGWPPRCWPMVGRTELGKGRGPSGCSMLMERSGGQYTGSKAVAVR